MDQTTKAKTFQRLHAGGDILVLPNAWDAASAALMADAGAKAVATSSAAVAWAHGCPDGDALSMDKVVATVREIARVVDLPVTCDFEGGYTDDLAALAENIAQVVDAGAVGINLEDGGRDPALHARKVAAVRAAAQKAGVDLFINARTDVFLRKLAEGEAAFEEAVRRAKLYADAGASGVFTPGAADEALIERLAEAIPLPLNIMLLPTLPPAARLQALGVRRLSSATAPFRLAYASLKAGVEAYLATGEAQAFASEALPNLNARFG